MNTYKKLKNGSWGLLVEGYCRPGMVVRVQTKGGKIKTETIGKIYWTGDGVSICGIAPKNEQPVHQVERETAQEVKPDAKRPDWVMMDNRDDEGNLRGTKEMQAEADRLVQESEPQLSTPTIPVGYQVYRCEEDFGF